MIPMNDQDTPWRELLPPGAHLFCMETVDSTNAAAKRLALAGEPEGTVVTAVTQTGGRGRMGRSFFSPAGGLYFSVILRPQLPPEEYRFLTPAAAVAAVRAIRKVCGLDCGIKWVNDLYLGGRKICGILTEGGFSADPGSDYVILGIGVNLTDPPGGFPAEIADRAGSLYGTKPLPDGLKMRLLGQIVSEFFSMRSRFAEHEFLTEYRERSVLTGKRITFVRDGETHSAAVREIDRLARLIVEENGALLALDTGEVSVREE